MCTVYSSCTLEYDDCLKENVLATLFKLCAELDLFHRTAFLLERKTERKSWLFKFQYLADISW